MSNQMPGPGDNTFESGFNPVGEDMSGLASPAAYPVGVALPGDANGFDSGEDMRGMASSDPIPQANDFGSAGNDGIPDQDGDLASSAGFHIIGSLGQGMGNVTSVFSSLENNSGEHGSSDGGPVHGFDSMRGIALGPGSGPAPRGEQNTNSVGGIGDQTHTIE
jgi:hypothetical protein